jgi:hypothetical protein
MKGWGGLLFSDERVGASLNFDPVRPMVPALFRTIPWHIGNVLTCRDVFLTHLWPRRRRQTARIGLAPLLSTEFSLICIPPLSKGNERQSSSSVPSPGLESESA